MKLRKLLLLAALAALPHIASAARPRLIVQIVVGSMRAGDLERYADNFEKGGFLRLTEGGVRYTDSRYDYQQTVTPVSLATLTTGAMPATHGVVGDRWRDYADNASVSLTAGWEGPGPYHLVAPTLAEALQEQSPDSRIVTVAAEATSAVVTAGRGGDAYWLDSLRCDWESSRYYAEQLPDWVVRSNRERDNLVYADSEWHMLLNEYYYRNTRRRAIAPAPHNKKSGDGLRLRNGYERLLATPAGNSAVLAFAAKAVAQYKLGADEKTDLLNICLDASRRITEKYGPESVEVEDMYYRLDSDLAEFLTFLFAQVEPENTLVVLTSDHGSSPSYDAGREEADRFNTRQFEVIVNGFLNVRYGIGNWVLEYRDRGLYLNHNLIYERGLNLADVQNEVAIFAMQFRGVSHAQSATALRTSYFGSVYARLMQNSFYPRRSGDVILNLMPGWIEERPGCVSLSGSMYGYDTAVPLVFYGAGLRPQRIRHRVDMTLVAPTLARVAEIAAPAASEGDILAEIAE